jgi:predicted RNA binding protein YcfA (HicA-like mRNA interferase family)
MTGGGVRALRAPGGRGERKLVTRLPRVTARDTLRALQADGWVVVRIAGGHTHLGHSTKPGICTVAMHAGTIPLGTLRSIIRQAGLTVDQFRALL